MSEEKLNTNELIRLTASRTGNTIRETTDTVEAFLDVLESNMVGGKKVSLSKIGIFSTKVRAARVGRNPQNGDSLDLPEKTVVVFKPAKALRESIA